MSRKKTKPPVEPPKPPEKSPLEPQIQVPNTSPQQNASLPDLTNEQKQQIDHELHLLNGKICEFLKCYLLLGYTFDGQPVQIVSVKTQQDMDSLNHTLQRFLMANAVRQLPPKEENDKDNPD